MLVYQLFLDDRPFQKYCYESDADETGQKMVKRGFASNYWVEPFEVEG